MTATRTIVAALALACMSAPALAHGHGGMSPGGNQPSSHQETNRWMNHDQATNKSNHVTTPISQQHVKKLTQQQQAQVILHLSAELKTLIQQYGAALNAGNRAEIARTLREIGRLNAIALKDGVIVFIGQGAGGHNVDIGRLPGRILLDGKSVQI
jgi:hypothetical protein